MLAALPTSQYPRPMAHAAQSDTRGVIAPPTSLVEDDRPCAGCNRSVSSESGGVVVAFGNSLWHVDCFKCAKCGTQVNAETNLLLLSDGSPVCANCYNCKVCNLPILDEAVMTGEDSYHAACFTCRTCRKRIDELVFAKTSQGFYCMKCHNERVARSRRHMAKQKQRERDRQASGANNAGGDRATGSSSRQATATEASIMLPQSNDRGGISNGVHQGHNSPQASSEDHSHSRSPLHSPMTSSYSSGPSVSATGSSSTQATSSAAGIATGSVADATVIPKFTSESLTMSPEPHPASPRRLSATVTAPSTSTSVPASSAVQSFSVRGDQTRPNSLPEQRDINSVNAAATSSLPRASLDGPPPPPYSVTPPPSHGYDRVAQNSTSHAQHLGGDAFMNRSRNRVGSSPASPTTGVSLRGANDATEHQRYNSDTHVNLSGRESPSSLAYLSPNSAESSRLGEAVHRRRTSHDGDRSLAPSQDVQNVPTSSVSAPLEVPTSRRLKRASINPGLQLEASRWQSNGSSSLSPSPTSPSPSGSNSISVPLDRSRSPTTPVPGGRESPRISSPLEDYFAESDDGGSTGKKSDSSTSNLTNGSLYYSPQPSPQPVPGEPPAPTPVPTALRSMTAPPLPASRSSAAKNVLARPPHRSDSLRGREDNLSSPRGNRLYPNVPVHVLKQKRSFDERGGHLSPRARAEFGAHEIGRRSRSVSPKPPDVPRSIESGTDTDADADTEADEVATQRVETHSRESSSSSSVAPPALPPKDMNVNTKLNLASGAAAQVPANREATVSPDDDENSPRDVDGQDGSSPVFSTTERHSAFFVAPELPPMRFSMSGTDFNDILNSLGGSTASALKRLSMSNKVDRMVIPAPTDSSIAEEGDNASQTRRSSRQSTIVSSSIVTESAQAAGSSVPQRRTSKRSNRTPTPDAVVVRDGARSTSPSSPALPIRSLHRLSKSEAAGSNGSASPRTSGDSRHPISPRMSGSSESGTKVDVDTRQPSISVISPPESPMLRLNGVRPPLPRQDTADLVSKRLKEALSNAAERNVDHIKLDRAFVEAILVSVEHKKEQMAEMAGKLDGMKRTSQMIIDGLSVAQEEYDHELAARRNAEAEVSRLRIELSGQAAKLTALSSDERKHELQQKLSRELSNDLSALERALSKLKAERDMALAEVEELSASKSNVSSNGDVPVAALSRSLTMRLDNIKKQYQFELIPLTQQREVLMREIAELKEARDIFLEETAVLNARNEELAKLNSQIQQRTESAATPERPKQKAVPPQTSTQRPSMDKPSTDTWKARQPLPIQNALSSSTTSSATSTLIEEPPERSSSRQAKYGVDEVPVPQTRQAVIPGLRWPGKKANKEQLASPFAVTENQKGKRRMDHTFQQLSILRIARCDHCGDKMWGSQVRCSACNLAVHVRCVNHVSLMCLQDGAVDMNEEPAALAPPPQPSMFGRDLIEQVRADSRNGERVVPVIVEKCIDAVETLAMDYEGIYRKSGGSGQSKAITGLFERGDYASFDLRDSDTFNDISSVTSVLKNYFRSLPNPLLTYALHEEFAAAAGVKDPQVKSQALRELVSRLPKEHYHTLSHLMQHLHRIQKQSDKNRMNARNLGVIFGPTLMRSQDPGREFSDMAGKSLAIEWLIENAPSVFSNIPASR